MGNEVGLPSSNLGITSLSVTTPNIEMKEIEKLYNQLRDIANKKQSDMITRDEIHSALKHVDKFQPPDSELFIQLFTLFDEDGHNEINYKSYICGSSVCLISSPIKDKLKFVLSIYDNDKKSACMRGDLRRVLQSINITASYFGDPVLLPNEIENIVQDTFKTITNTTAYGISHDECIDYLITHDLVKKFIQGEGQVRFGSSELTSA
jgi:Ca2+-binding EF-hand superfamily protein